MASLIRLLLTVAILLGSTAAPARLAAEHGSVAWRIVKAGGDPADPAVRAHLEFSAAVGFNAAWIAAEHAGDWRAGKSDRAFLEQAAQLKRLGLEPTVALDPASDPRRPFVFSEPRDERRLRRFARRLHRRAGVRHLVLVFRGAPTRLTELRDLLRYGQGAAPAHLDLAQRLRRRLPPDLHLWLALPVSSGLSLDRPDDRYARDLLRGIAELDRHVGVVWNGPHPVSPSISRSDLATARHRLHDRPMLLEDPFPANHSGGRLALDLVLGPLRGRDPRIREVIDGYLACPMEELAASRLSLLTVADFLADPPHYDPETSWQSAMARLAGDDSAALDALRVQAMEWGGPIGGRNYHTAATSNPVAAAAALRDPAAVASTRWTILRYPQRMAALDGLADAVFRDGLLEGMARRLAVSRAMPVVRELVARHAAGRTDLAPLIARLRREEALAAESPGAALALRRFLAAAGVAGLLEAPDD